MGGLGGSRKDRERPGKYRSIRGTKYFRHAHSSGKICIRKCHNINLINHGSDSQSLASALSFSVF